MLADIVREAVEAEVDLAQLQSVQTEAVNEREAIIEVIDGLIEGVEVEGDDEEDR